ncbi:MAG: hypothetical protein H7831_03980 [Magnetococcus sp. WYHC-3]
MTTMSLAESTGLQAMENPCQAVVVLRAETCRRLLGAAVATLPYVRQRCRQGRMVIVGGSTTRHVVHALLGEDPGLDSFAVGWIRHGQLGQSDPAGRGPGPYLFQDGHVSRGWPGTLIEAFQPGDVYIKGANALDPAGHALVLMASPNGGSIGVAHAILMARGGRLVVPVSLSKSIPSVPDAVAALGQQRAWRTMGTPVGAMPIMAGTATLVTEREALRLLFGVETTVVACSGLEDCQGALTCVLSGSASQVAAAWDWIHDPAHQDG